MVGLSLCSQRKCRSLRRDPNATTQTRGTPPYDKSAPKVTPQLVLAIEHYNRIVRMLQAGEPVKMTVDLSVAWQEADLDGLQHDC